ncbi:oligosaccharide repeat unit polymerase, partial [Paraprevotella clara]|uniref:oligosaccharide repeat unit polymerase n=1 Tax=Paraprevotella clara TaxID=454154 RepID=UPI003A8EFEEC
MLMIAFGILLVLAVWGWCFSKDIFSPFVLQPGVWCVILLLYQILPHDFFPLVNDFLLSLIVWNIGFLLSAYLSFYYTPSSSRRAVEATPNKLVIQSYFILSLITMPIVIGIIIWIAYVEDPVNMFRYLRVMNTGVDENIEAPDLGVLYYLVSMTYVLLFFVLLYGRGKWVIVLVLLLNLLFAFVTMAKTVFLSVLLPTLYIAYLNKKIKLKHIC